MLQQLIYPDIFSKLTRAFLIIKTKKKEIRLDNNRKKVFYFYYLLLIIFNYIYRFILTHLN